MKITVATIVLPIIFGGVTSVHAADCADLIQSSLQHFGAEPADARGERSVCGDVRCVMSRESAFFIEQIEGTRASYIKVTKVINNQPPVAEYFEVERQNDQNCEPSDLKRIAKPGHTNALAAETANFFGLLGLGSLVTGVALDTELEEKGFSSRLGVFNAMGVLEDCPKYQKAGGSMRHNDYGVVVTTGGSKGNPTNFSFLAFLAGPACFAQAIAQEVRKGVDIEDSLRPGGGLADDGGVTLQAPDRIDDYSRYVVRKEGLDIRQEMEDGSTVTIDSAEVHISAKTNTRKKTRFEGVRKMGDKSQPFFMETVFQDYRQVPGSALYMPYRQILKTSGITPDDQTAEIRQADTQLAEFEQQMAAMPADQRAMMERMLGPQMQQMRALASGKPVEIVVTTTSIELDPADVGSEGEGPADPRLILLIQHHLQTLGYDPGRLNGKLTESTISAISQFEADSGLAVTGRATPALAEMLEAKAQGR